MSDAFVESNRLLARATQVTPLGSQTYSKSYRYFCQGVSPAFLDRGKGCYVWDIDGNKYIDFICALGPVIIGYSDPRVNAAVVKQLEKGISFSLPTRLEVELAELLTEILPWTEMVRFVKNGSDATTAAVRLARAYTGREMVAVCGYHGMQDWYIGSTPNNRGVPKAVCDLTLAFDYNNIDSVKELFNTYPGQIAAVILEPIQGDGPRDNFLQVLKELTHENGAMLIFDEVVSGFRYALGGASEIYRVSPDLAAFGKGMGNGLPISAVAGKKEIMKLIETKGVFISTTFGGEALSLAGAIETIKILRQPGTYEHINRLGTLILEGLNSLVKRHHLESVLTINGIPSHAYITFEGLNSLDYLDILSVYQQKLLQNGILSLGIFNLSLAHSETEIGLLLAASEEAMLDIKRVIEQDSLAGVLMSEVVSPVFRRTPKVR